MGSWLQTAPGRYLHQWEQQRLDDAVADAFGFHALQLGLPEVDALRANRMPHRWVLASGGLTAVDADDRTVPPGAARVALLSEFDALPFAADSIDLVVLPHVLEFAADPHQTLREVERVLRPQGRIVIVGLNPTSLWGLRQRLSPQRLGLVPPTGEGEGEGEGPRAAEFIGYWRLRDWLRLLQFELESVSFGCWRPAVRSSRRLARFAWMDRLGARWWPIFGAGYVMLAVKRTHGARLIGASWKAAPMTAAAPASVANRAAAPHTLTESELEPR